MERKQEPEVRERLPAGLLYRALRGLWAATWPWTFGADRGLGKAEEGWEWVRRPGSKKQAQEEGRMEPDPAVPCC